MEKGRIENVFLQNVLFMLMFTDSISLSLSFADNSSVIAATATTSKNSTTDQPRYPKSCIKKVKFSSESLKSDVDGLCEQLKDNVLSDLSNFNINNNNNNIDNIKYNNKKMSDQDTTTNAAESGGEAATQGTATDGGERPSFLVRKLSYLSLDIIRR